VEAVWSPGGLLASPKRHNGLGPSLTRGQILYAAITKASAIATFFNLFSRLGFARFVPIVERESAAPT
jgi:hypothetical protein